MTIKKKAPVLTPMSHRDRTRRNEEMELNRLRQLCELFIPKDVWQNIHLLERIVEEGLDAVKGTHGMESDDVIVALSKMLYQIIHCYDPTLEDSRDNEETAMLSDDD